MRFAVLGAVTAVDDDGEAVVLRGAKSRALLAALLLEPNSTVPPGSVMAVLWGEEPPPTATASLHNHLARLRRALHDSDGTRLRTMSHGLHLRVEEGEADREVFEGLVRRAQEARGRGEWDAAERHAGAALALWRGAPFADVPALAGHPVVTYLQEQRVEALECRFEALLRLDRLDGLAAELGALVEEHPFRETLHRQLMLVLGRTGRQAEALALFRSLRRTLVEELGVEPGPALQEAHREVLAGTPARPHEPLTPTAGTTATPTAASTPATGSTPTAASTSTTASPPTAASTAASAPAVTAVAGAVAAVTSAAPATTGAVSGLAASTGAFTVSATPPSTAALPLPVPTSATPTAPAGAFPRPEQLPVPPAGFVGRDRAVASIRAVLEAERDRTAVVVVSGMPGVGKTGLALHVAAQFRDAFPDGRLYLDLHGATPGRTPLAPADALAALLHGLGVDARHVPGDVAAGSALLRSALAPTRTLLVLDDAASVGQVRPLLPAGAGCAVLVTSRQPLATLGASAQVPLDPLSPREGALLLERASGRSWGAADAEPVARLAALCGHLPLALRICAARLRSRRALPVARLTERLARQEDRLDHLELEDLSVRRSLLAAHEALLGSGDPRDADAAAALVLIGALDLPEYGVPMMAVATDRTERCAERALDRLTEVALLQERGWGRYVPHDLVRDFARELAARPDARAAHADAVERSLHWYRRRLAHCAAALRPGRGGMPELSPGGDLAFADAAEALAWGDQEAANLLHLAGSGAPEPLGLEPTRTSGPTEVTRTSGPPEVTRTSGPLVPAQTAGPLEPTLLRGPLAPTPTPERLGPAPMPESQPPTPMPERLEPTPMPERLEPTPMPEPLQPTPMPEPLQPTRANTPLGPARTLELIHALFPYLHDRGRSRDLERLTRHAVTLARSGGDAAAEGRALGHLASAHYSAGRIRQALRLLDEAVRLSERLADDRARMRHLGNRAALLRELGRGADARATLARCLALRPDTLAPAEEALLAGHQGYVAELTDPRSALPLHRRSRELARRAGSTVIEQVALCNTGRAQLALGEPARALRSFDDALRLMASGAAHWNAERETRLGRAQALRALDRLDPAREACGSLLREAAERGDAYGRGLAEYEYGQVLRALGDDGAALRHWRGALTALEGTDAPVLHELRSLTQKFRPDGRSARE
ncbi:BTAD domain-containing putative transcriptional regulator [Streptomyces ossamyceticus]|nr:BTAD domain-containing putative transcriptional regulator [Streptomyces ossamyceticus]